MPETRFTEFQTLFDDPRKPIPRVNGYAENEAYRVLYVDLRVGTSRSASDFSFLLMANPRFYKNISICSFVLFIYFFIIYLFLQLTLYDDKLHSECFVRMTFVNNGRHF